ncbi:MAG TPA: hypothetical protein DCS42_15055 [Nitrospiraceae bacterium]|nr:hypothetical protein [Nitrospiraceae bacterium]
MTTEFKVLLDKKRSYKHSLPCPECGTSLLHNCVRNGVRYVDGTKENPKRIWNADLYKCAGCGILVLTDFGWPSQWNKKNTPDLQALLDYWKKRADAARAQGSLADVFVYSWQFGPDNSSTINGTCGIGRFEEAA